MFPPFPRPRPTAAASTWGCSSARPSILGSGPGISNLGTDLAWKVRHADQRSNTTEDALPRILVFGASQRLLDALLLAG